MSKRKTAQMRNAARRMRAAGYELLPPLYFDWPSTTKDRFRDALRDFMMAEWIGRLRKLQKTHTCEPRPKRQPRTPRRRYRGLPF